MATPSTPKLGRLRVLARKLMRPSVIELDGVRVRADEESVRKGLYKGTYEWQERALVRRAIGRGDRVLEIGGRVSAFNGATFVYNKAGFRHENVICAGAALYAKLVSHIGASADRG